MSRLSRFKKGPAIKLPKKLVPQPQPSRFEDSDDDDDFVSRPVKASSRTVTPSPKPEPKSPHIEPSVSEYFQPSTSRLSRKRDPISSGKPPVEAAPGKKNKEKGNARKENAEKEKPRPKSIDRAESVSRKPKVTTKDDTSDNNESEKVSVPPPPDESDNDSETQGKVVCPFCWKKLGDKLTGTTHVKACAKDVPIQRVFEAMQLQEKQIEEWEKLGLEFPGFLNNNANNKKTKNANNGAPRARGGSRNRKKKPETPDPEFELAVALSMSLHEEFESRTVKENEFLIENGLEKEVGLVDIKPKLPVIKEDAARAVNQVVIPAAAPVSRRRGKKLPIDQLPLYAVNGEQKKAIICERVTKILDESENHKNEKFYIREEIPANAFGVPKRLVPLQDKESTLWSRAQESEDLPNESFSVLELPDPKDQLETVSRPSPRESETPKHHSPELSSGSAIQVNAESNVIKNECLVNAPLPSESSGSKRPETNVCKMEESESVIKRRKSPILSSHSSLTTKSSEGLQKLPRVIQDITEMLVLRKDCDMALYGREEKAIKCHSFMITARCPKLLKDVIEEKSGKQTRRLVPLTNFSHKAVKAFLWYIYTGEFDKANDEDLTAELKDLASTYDMQIDSNIGHQSQSVANCRSVEVQTDRVPTQNSSSMTEKSDRWSTETGFQSFVDYKGSQELFTTMCEEHEAETSIGENKCEDAAKEKLEESDHINCNDSENEDVQSDVDLFEDIENELKMSIALNSSQHSESENNKSIEAMDKSGSPLLSDDDENVSFDEEDLMDQLASPPVTLTSKISEKKRSRSVSPILADSQGLYSATQIAHILHRGGGGHVKSKANKKQKLDTITSDCEMMCDDNDHSKDGLDLKENDNLDKSVDGDNDKWKDDSIFSNLVNCATPTLFNKSRSSRRSISTPNLSIKEPNSSVRFYNQQTSVSDEEDDPFADGYEDDSVFANIPDEILMKKKTPEVARTLNTHKDIDVSKCTSQTSLTPLSRSRRRRHSPRDLSNEDVSFSTTTKRGAQKGRGNGKAKASAKIKLPAKLPASNKQQAHKTDKTCETEREDTFLSQQLPVSKPVAESPGGNSKSPLLNYSLIDTPILKQELKKYGIKPLPRSKAKVLLRHIYKETHK